MEDTHNKETQLARRWGADEPISAAKLNETVDAVNRPMVGVRPAYQELFTPRGGAAASGILALTIATPASKPEMTDHRYWVREVYVSNGAAAGVYDAPLFTATDPVNEFVAANLAENLCQSHMLRNTVPVLVYGSTDTEGVMRHWFHCPPSWEMST
ncbi:unnamed protein product [marine sediment metagenome]|uniref:Uncharacterized protein n=1 Tax=marine sediment metagenome TaxID=412755 RepID=X0SYH3_9ZZZZ